MKFSSWLKPYIYKYILLFCSHSLVFKCQPDCSNQDQHFFNSSMHPCESRRNSNYPQSCRYSESAFIQIPWNKPRFCLQTAIFVCCSETSQCVIFHCLQIGSRVFWFFLFKSICVLCLSIVLLWALEYLTFQRCSSSNAPRWLCFAWGCSHTGESYSAPKTAVGVTKSGVPSVY